MARFVYRLQKVFELRERRKKEQERRVQEAQARVHQIEAEITAKKEEIKTLRQHMFQSSHLLMETHDIFIHHLNEELDQLNNRLEMAKEQLAYEKRLLIKAQADMEALIKHKEKAYEDYLEEEKRLELKMLDEIGTQRYFRAQAEKLAEEGREDAEQEDALAKKK
jgi:flagellar protein FliJ